MYGAGHCGDSFIPYQISVLLSTLRNRGNQATQCSRISEKLSFPVFGSKNYHARHWNFLCLSFLLCKIEILIAHTLLVLLWSLNELMDSKCQEYIKWVNRCQVWLSPSLPSTLPRLEHGSGPNCMIISSQPGCGRWSGWTQHHQKAGVQDEVPWWYQECPWGECGDEIEDLKWWLTWEKVGCVGEVLVLPFRVGYTANIGSLVRLWPGKHSIPLTCSGWVCGNPVLIFLHPTIYTQVHTSTVALNIKSKS